jgi:hypothetical protein
LAGLEEGLLFYKSFFDKALKHGFSRGKDGHSFAVDPT